VAQGAPIAILQVVVFAANKLKNPAISQPRQYTPAKTLAATADLQPTPNGISLPSMNSTRVLLCTSNTLHDQRTQHHPPSMSTSRASTSLSAVRSLPRAAKSSAPSFSSSRRNFSSSPSTSETYFNPWRGKSHLKKPITIPNPLPALYPQRVLLSDGSTFTSYTTAPTPAILRLTRDVTNNPLWAPGTETRGAIDEEGRVGKFKRRFEGMDFGSGSGSTAGGAEGAVLDGEGVVVDDLSWMSEGGREEAAPPPKVFKKGAPTKGKRK